MDFVTCIFLCGVHQTLSLSAAETYIQLVATCLIPLRTLQKFHIIPQEQFTHLSMCLDNSDLESMGVLSKCLTSPRLSLSLIQGVHRKKTDHSSCKLHLNTHKVPQAWPGWIRKMVEVCMKIQTFTHNPLLVPLADSLTSALFILFYFIGPFDIETFFCLRL